MKKILGMFLLCLSVLLVSMPTATATVDKENCYLSSDSYDVLAMNVDVLSTESAIVTTVSPTEVRLRNIEYIALTTKVESTELYPDYDVGWLYSNSCNNILSSNYKLSDVITYKDKPLVVPLLSKNCSLLNVTSYKDTPLLVPLV